jgi:hypothetical protein
MYITMGSDAEQGAASAGIAIDLGDAAYTGESDFLIRLCSGFTYGMEWSSGCPLALNLIGCIQG